MTVPRWRGSSSSSSDGADRWLRCGGAGDLRVPLFYDPGLQACKRAALREEAARGVVRTALSGDELFKVKNVGEKALTEIAEMLETEGLNFGMKFQDVDGDVRIVEQGTAPMVVAAAITEES